MSVDIHPTGYPADPDTTTPGPNEPAHGPRPRPRRPPTARVIALALGVGATSALVLTLVVFAGATESVITGSVLLAFGFGWALIAALSERLTSEPSAGRGSRRLS